MTGPPEVAYQWRSWHLHADSLDPKVSDRLLTYAVGPLIDGLTVADGHAPLWFFIRYWLHGPHIRLRIAGLDDGHADAIERDLESLVALAGAALTPAARADDAGYRRAATSIAAAGEAGVAIDPGRLLRAGVYARSYEPEYERYGGHALMPVSERLFHASSVTALDVCRAGDGAPMAKGLEALAVSCGVLPSDPRGFLITMRDRWTRWLAAGQPGIDAAVIDRAARVSAARVAGTGPALVAAIRGGHPPSWSPWVQAVGVAMEAWQRSLEPVALRRVFGSQLHMMQNRLGVGAGGEAYLAAILLHLLDA